MIDSRIVRVALAILVVAALIGYIIEFIRDQENEYYNTQIPGVLILNRHRGHPGYITLFVCITIFTIVGLFAAFAKNRIVAAIFVVCYFVLMIVDTIYIGDRYAIILGTMAWTGGFFYLLFIWEPNTKTPGSRKSSSTHGSR